MGTSLGTLTATIGLDTEAIRRDAARLEQTFQQIGDSARRGLGGVSTATVDLDRHINNSQRVMKSLSDETEHLRARLQVLSTPTGQAMLKEQAALKGQIAKVSGEMEGQSGQADVLSGALGGVGRKLLGVMAGYLTLRSALRVMDFVVRSGQEAETVWNNVDASLKLHRLEVAKNTLEMGAFADAQMRATGASDELVAKGITRLLDYNFNLEDSYRLIAAAQDLAVGKDMDLMSAADILGKSIDSNVNALGRYGIEIDKSLPRAAQLEQALAQVNERFGGRAAEQIGTSAGKMALLREQTGNLAENLYDKLKPGIDATTDSLIEMMDSLVDSTNSVQKAVAGTTAARKKFEELITGTKDQAGILAMVDRYDELAKKSELTASEQEELHKILSRIRDFMPNAVTGWDALNNAIGINTDYVRRNIEAQRLVYRASQDKALSKMTGEYEDLLQSRKDLEADVKKIEAEPWRNIIVLLRGEKFYQDLLMRLGDDKINLMAKEQEFLAGISMAYDLSKPKEYAIAVARLGKELADAARAWQAAGGGKTEKFIGPMPLLLDKEALGRQLAVYDAIISSGQATAGELEAINEAYTASVLGNQDKELEGVQGVSDETIAAYKRVVGEVRQEKLGDAIYASLRIPQKVSIYEELIASGKLAKEELLANWGNYALLQEKQFKEAARKVGELPAKIIAAWKAMKTDELADRLSEAILAAEHVPERVSLYAELLKSDALSVQERLAIWEGYKAGRLRQIDAEYNHNARRLSQQDAQLKRKSDTAALEEEGNRYLIINPLQEQRGIYEELLRSDSLNAAERASVWAREYEIELGLIDSFYNELKIKMPEVAELYRSTAMADLAQKRGADLRKDLNDQIGFYDELFKSQYLTKEELESLWGDYEQKRLEQIAAEADAMEALGRDYQGIAAYVAEQNATLDAMRHELEDKVNRPWMNPPDDIDSWQNFALNAAAAMNEAFENSFFKVMQGEFAHLRDFFKSIVDDMTNYIQQKLAEKMADMFTDIIWKFIGSVSGGGGGSEQGDFFGGGPTYGAEGGLFRTPTLAVIGEAGPEILVPIDKLADERFWKLNGIDLGSLGIRLPDDEGFKAKAGGLERLADKLKLPAYASGGLVAGPELAILGERGPEVVAPISRLNDERFWAGLGLEGHGGGNVINHVNMNVQTPDLASFKASQSQMLSWLNVAMSQATQRSM